ncbi:unnamed protein product [marine sediment metagenome]|uniref:Uncharacterized protein n=1 Tax=marine sediment metagenome TaxID=412755 RepID=X0VHV8_9ZZZZ
MSNKFFDELNKSVPPMPEEIVTTPQPKPVPKKKSKKTIVILSATILLILVGLGSYFGYVQYQGQLQNAYNQGVETTEAFKNGQMNMIAQVIESGQRCKPIFLPLDKSNLTLIGTHCLEEN